MFKCYSIQTELDKRMTLKGHTNMTLAKTVGVSYQHLSSIRNKKINASPKLAKRIADTLGVEIEEIFTIEAKKEAN